MGQRKSPQASLVGHFLDMYEESMSIRLSMSSIRLQVPSPHCSRGFNKDNSEVCFKYTIIAIALLGMWPHNLGNYLEAQRYSSQADAAEFSVSARSSVSLSNAWEHGFRHFGGRCSERNTIWGFSPK